MSELFMVLVIATLLLVPLAPAAAIYYLLSAKRARERTRARGDASFGNVNLFGFRISFEAFGSTATYLVILALAIGLFIHMQNIERQERAVRAQAAWQVEVPVYIEGARGPLDPSDPIYTQIHTSLLPFQTISNNLLTFWVIKERGRFPQVNLAIAATAGHSIDLNDSSKIEIDESNNKLRVSTPTLLTLQAPYDAPPSQGPPP